MMSSSEPPQYQYGVLREKKIQIGPRAECFSVLTTLEAEKQAAIAAAASRTNVEESIEEVH